MDSEGSEVELPAPSHGNTLFVSDAIADVLRDLAIPYVALNPGASYRGLHDSLVNHLGNRTPSMLLCLHEEHAIGIAHGWAKVTGRAMAAAVHANVGLMHATMGMFNAWCDRVPMLVLGATGPVDAMKRRPWVDWVHTARDQGALVRPYTKWDDQPASAGAAREALLRGVWLANTAPCGPVYINLDAGLQEEALDKPLPPLDSARYQPLAETSVPASAIERAAAMLKAAKSPVLLAGRVSRSEEAWAARIKLAEALGAKAMIDMHVAASFPSDHPLYAGRPWDSRQARETLAAADVILSLDWLDLGGTLTKCGANGRVIQVSTDHQIHNGWSMDHQAHPPVDLLLAADPDQVVPALLAAVGEGRAPAPVALDAAAFDPAKPPSLKQIGAALQIAAKGRPLTFTQTSSVWDLAISPIRHPLDHFGSNGGGGLGSSASIAIGIALALRDAGSPRVAVAVLGDGDFLMGVTAIWTAVHYAIPVLYLVVNNRSYYNDETHQQRVAEMRDRPVENKWIGQRISGPDVDIAQLARGQGALGIGPITTGDGLLASLAEAIGVVAAGGVAVLDVHVAPGDAPRPASSMGRAAG